MKLFARLRHLMLFAVVLVFAGRQAEAQSVTYSVTSSANSLQLSNTVTFTIGITNLTDQPLYDLVVTDSLPASVEITNTTTDSLSSDVVSSNLATFTLSPLGVGLSWQITVTALPSATGLITNSVTIYTPTLVGTAETNLVVDVTNLMFLANLGIALTPPAQASIVGDAVTYGITVTNGGPDPAPDVLLTNTLPPGVILESISPVNLNVSTNNGNLLFDLGALGANSVTNLQLTVEPTNAGVLPFSAGVGSAGITNVSYLNTVANSSLSVSNIELGVLGVITNAGQIDNLQNGLEEQTVLLTNISAGNISAARVVVSGIPKRLYNAVGTNGGNPYVTYVAPTASPLGNGQSVALRLQYYPDGSFAFTNVQLQLEAYPVPLPNLTPPATTGTSTKINFKGIFRLNDGSMLLDFPATAGRTYTVVYSDNVTFSNAMTAPPSFMAGANDVQWIDFGPPDTVSAPTNSNARFYRVIQNP